MPNLLARGFRMWVNYTTRNIRFYRRFQFAIDPLLPTDIRAAMQVLAGMYDRIKALNPEGPM